MWGVGLFWGFYFFFYNVIKLYKIEGRVEWLEVIEYFVLVVEVGVMIFCIINLLWVIKICFML